MGVLDRLPEGKPLAVLRELDQVSRELKSPQTRKSDSVINYRIFSGLVNDIVVPGGYVKYVVEIEFIPDNKKFSGALCYRMYAVLTGVGGFVDQVNLRRQMVDYTNGHQKWRYNYQSGVPQGIKFYFFAQGSGTFTVNLI